MENKFEDNYKDENTSIHNDERRYDSDPLNHNPNNHDSDRTIINNSETEVVISSDNPNINEDNNLKEVYSPNLNNTQYPNYYNTTPQNVYNNSNSYTGNSFQSNSYQGNQYQGGFYQGNPYHVGSNQGNAYQGNQYQANQTYQPNYTNNNYQGYQNNIHNISQTGVKNKQEDKKAKKKGSFGPMKLVASAIAFGVIAGTAFQGYSYLAQLLADPNEIVEEEKFELSQADSSVIPVNSETNGIISDVSGVVENVMPSIVAINSSATVTSYDFFGRRFNEPVQGSGSGIIIGQNGSEILIVTNNHVIDGAEKVEIVFVDESIAMATVKGAEAKSDLAVLSVKLSDLSKETSSKIKVATLGDSNSVKAGEMAIAIGNALGYGQSVTVGYISALNREVNIENVKMNLLQTDAAINPGNSGGALINIYGQVIGINSVKYASAEVEGMGYAIPISDAIPMINELMNREILEESEKGFLGIRLDNAQEVTEIFSKRFNMPIGIYVNSIVPNSPAEKAGLKEGNIIIGVNNKKIETIDDLLNFLSYTRAGEKITLVIKELDNGKYIEKKLEVVLGQKQKN